MSGTYRTPYECEQIFLSLDSGKRSAAVEHLQSWFSEEDRQRIRKVIAAHGRYGWIYHLYDDEVAKEPSHQGKAVIAASGHLRFATLVRNELRVAGYGERDLGIRNLDEIYTFLVEEALKEPA